MKIFGQLNSTKSAEPDEMFCGNLARHIASMDEERPQNRETYLELRNLAFAHFVAAHRLLRTAVKDDPVLSEFRAEFAALPTSKYLQIVGLMHAYGARKCCGDSPRTLSMLFDCIAEAYEMPDFMASSWNRPHDIQECARFRAQNIAQILGRPEDAARLAPSLHVLDRKILLYLAFLVQEPELVQSIESESGSSEPVAAK